MIRKIVILCFLVVAGCGYTTRGFVYDKENTIYVNPVVNKSSITSGKRAYSSYNVYPILLEKRLTNAIIDKFNIDGNLRVSDDKSSSLNLQCEIRNYNKEPLRYTDNDNVTEQRLRLYTHCILSSKDGKVLKERDIVGDTTYFLSGKLAKTEPTAQVDLVDDTARRIIEMVVEEW